MIVDVNGNPVKMGDLREMQTSRVAYSSRLRIESHLRGLTPARAARILRDADHGQLRAQAELFDDMLDRDAHLRCEYDKRKDAPLALSWSVEPPAQASRAEKAAAAYAEEILRDAVDDLDSVLLAAMDAPGHGYAATELEWQRWGGDILPSFFPRPQTWLTTDTERRELRLDDGTGHGAALRQFGWIIHAPKVKTGYIGRAGLLRTCLWPFLYKSYAVGDFAEFLEAYGLPIIVGRYMAGAAPEEKASLLRAVTALGHDARAIMPEGMALEIQSVAGGGSGNHLAMVDWADRAHSKAVLGQTTSSEARATGLGSGVADFHSQVRADILKSDARQLAATLTRDLVYPLIALNRPGVDYFKRCPRWVFDLGETEDLTAYADALPKLVGVGLRIPRAWAHEKLGIPEPDGDEEVLSIPQPEMTQPPALREPVQAAARALAALRTSAPPLDDAAAQLAPRLGAEAQPEIDGWLAQIEALLVDNPELTPAELQSRLLALYGDLPHDELVEIMAQGYALATLIGRAEVADGD